MSEKKETNHGVVKWLKRVFSLEFLGVLIGAASLYLAYVTFMKDTPGSLSLFNEKHHYSERIRYVFYGFEIDGDSLYFYKKDNFPSLANRSSNSIKDLTLTAFMRNNVGYKVDRSYSFAIKDDETGLQFPQLITSYQAERIGFGGLIPFPLTVMETKSDELLTQRIDLVFIYNGMDEHAVNLHYIIVGVPQHYRDDDGKEIDAEYAFIKAIRPILTDIEDPQQILIIYDKYSIEAPSKLDLLKEKDIRIRTINELN